jgi:hypothetical protein
MTLYCLYLRSHIRRTREQSEAQQSSPSPAGRKESPSMIYGKRCYSYAISGRHDFEAADDADALAIARNIFDAATDLCDTFDLWDGTRQVDQSRMAILQTNAACARRQEHVIRTEEALLSSDWAIARSRRLLARFNELRESSASTGDPVSPASTPC